MDGSKGSPLSRNRSRLAAALALTGAFLVVEVVAGILTGSLALLADAGHMSTDVGGLALALLAAWYSSRPATSARTYGFHRIEILAALGNALLLLLISFGVLVEAWRRLWEPTQIAVPGMLLVGLAGLVVNLCSMALLRKGAGESLNLRGAYLELFSDAISSVGVVAGAGLIYLTGWLIVDPILSAGIGLFIIPRTWTLLREAVGVLLEGTPPGIDIDSVRDYMLDSHGVAGVHDLHIWSLTSGKNVLSAHVTVTSGADPDTVLARLQELLRQRSSISHATLQIEAAACDQTEAHP